MTDEKKISFNDETKLTHVERLINNDFKPEDIKQIYETALKNKESYEGYIRHAEKVKSALKLIEKKQKLKDLIETIFLLTDLKSKFSIEQCDNVIKYYEPLIEQEKKTIDELGGIYRKIQDEKTNYIG